MIRYYTDSANTFKMLRILGQKSKWRDMDVEGVEEDEEMIIEKRDSVREEGQGNKRRKMQDV